MLDVFAQKKNSWQKNYLLMYCLRIEGFFSFFIWRISSDLAENETLNLLFGNSVWSGKESINSFFSKENFSRNPCLSFSSHYVLNNY